MTSKFDYLNSIENLDERWTALSNMIRQVLDTKEYQELLEWIAQESHSLTFTRSVLNELLAELKSKEEDQKYDILLSALNIFSQRVTAFEEQVIIPILSKDHNHKRTIGRYCSD